MDNVRLLNGYASGIPVATDIEASRLTTVLYQSYPNPFTGETVIQFQIPEHAKVIIRVYDVQGRRVVTLTDGEWGPGLHTLVWDGRSHRGHEVASGFYFYRMQTGAFQVTKRMVLMR